MNLTDRQVEVIHGIARGDSDAEIAVGLGIAARTVKLHYGLAARELDVEHRRQLPLAYYTQTGEDPWPRVSQPKRSPKPSRKSAATGEGPKPQPPAATLEPSGSDEPDDA